jgi:hypothetical protein
VPDEQVVKIPTHHGLTDQPQHRRRTDSAGSGRRRQSGTERK